MFLGLQKGAARVENLAADIPLNPVQINDMTTEHMRTLCTAVCRDKCTLY